MLMLACVLAAILGFVILLVCLVGMAPAEEMRAQRREFYRQIYGSRRTKGPTCS